MILEGIVTTLNGDDTTNVAPMGPRIQEGMGRFVLAPFQSSTTFANLKSRGEGVLHVTDDSLLIAKTAIGIPVDPPTRPASTVKGAVLLDACRFYEFRVAEIDESDERATIVAETVRIGRLRDFFGYNRARHAVIEAAIVATRADWLPVEELSAEFVRSRTIVKKTGGPDESLALDLLESYVRERLQSRGETWQAPPR